MDVTANNNRQNIQRTDMNRTQLLQNYSSEEETHSMQCTK